MEDIVQMRLVFVTGLLVMCGVIALLAYAIARLEGWREARRGRGRPARAPRQTVKNIPVRGTR